LAERAAVVYEGCWPDWWGPVIVATRKLGAAELLFDIQFSRGVEAVDDIVARAEQLWAHCEAIRAGCGSAMGAPRPCAEMIAPS